MSRLRSGVLRCLQVAIAAAVLLLPGPAQSVTGIISGTMSDSQKQVIRGAIVASTDEASPESRSAVTSSLQFKEAAC